MGAGVATPGSPEAIPPDCPEELLQALKARGATIAEFRRIPRRVRVRASSPSEKLFAWYSTDPADQGIVEHEVAVRAAIGTEGPLGAPPVLAYGPLWRLEPELEGWGDLSGGRIDALVDAIAVLQRSDLPQRPRSGDGGEGPIARWRRRLLMLRSPLPARDVVRARRVLSGSSLPLVTSHGRLIRNHIYPAPAGMWIVDWEELGKRPAGWDAVFLSWDLRDPDDRERLFLATLDLVGARYRSDLLALRYAALVNMLVGKLAGIARAERREEGRVLLGELPRVREQAGLA
jgi:hypothetical protein